MAANITGTVDIMGTDTSTAGTVDTIVTKAIIAAIGTLGANGIIIAGTTNVIIVRADTLEKVVAYISSLRLRTGVLCSQ